jgi:hypothetical protein
MIVQGVYTECHHVGFTTRLNSKRFHYFVDLGGLVVSVLATGPKVRWIFKGDKNPEHHFLRRGSKADLRHVKE